MSVRSKKIKNEVIFLGSWNIIFLDNWRKIIFQCKFFGKTIVSEDLQKKAYFHVFLWQRSSFIFRLKNKTIFSGKRNIIYFFMIIQKMSYSSVILWKNHLLRLFGEKIWFFVQWYFRICKELVRSFFTPRKWEC